MSDPSETWLAANRRHLLAAVAGVREQILDATAEARAIAAGAAAEAAREVPAPPAIDVLAASLGLSPFERAVLVMCAGFEVDASLGQAFQSRTPPYPTFALALAKLDSPHWSALTPSAPLRRYRLVDVDAGNLLNGRLRLDERVLHHLLGVPAADARLAGLTQPAPPAAELVPSQRAVAQRLAMIWRARGWGSPVAHLCGPDAAAKLDIVTAACAELGRPAHLARAADVPSHAAERETFARLCEREAALSGTVLAIDLDDADGPEAARAAAALVEAAPRAPFAILARDPLRVRRRSAVRVDVPKPSSAEQQQAWRGFVDGLGRGREVNGEIDRVVSQFSLGAPSIRAAGLQVVERVLDGDAAPIGSLLWDACRVQARPRLDDLADRLESTTTWDDIVLPREQMALLREITAQVKQRAKVYETWGFGARGGRGLGITALFAGMSGTGKTMAAEVLAGELRLDLYRIDLSQVVSKYIGETEKNLRRIFDAAEEGGAVLLFDEADALFGKRSEVKDSHDRYANLEVSYLLQRMDAYRGLAILTTNMRRALDTAFLRRLRFVVEFPFPGPEQRMEIWRRVFPRPTPTEGLDERKLARLSVAGGVVRNIALNAAFLAASAGEPVRMRHLAEAARVELAKMEKPPAEAEMGGWT